MSAKFNKPRIGIVAKTLHESFSALSKDDIKGDDIAGVMSLYAATKKQGTQLANDEAEKQAKEISESISKVYRSVKDSIVLGSDTVRHLEDFKRFAKLLMQAFQLNQFLDGDTIILKRLADILAYAYLKKNKGVFKIYSDFDAGKKVTIIVFNVARDFGLSLPTDVEDLVQKILLSVLYKPNKDEVDSSKDKKDATANSNPAGEPAQ